MTKKLYCYAVPNQMREHRFTDDVAICEAYNKEEAVDKFRKLYDPVGGDIKQFVHEVHYNNYGVAILTDY